MKAYASMYLMSVADSSATVAPRMVATQLDGRHAEICAHDTIAREEPGRHAHTFERHRFMSRSDLARRTRLTRDEIKTLSEIDLERLINDRYFAD